jgi:hypothetical protein
MAESTLMFKGMTAEQAFTQITGTGVTASDASKFIAGWIYENLGRTQRTFNYVTDFPQVDPDCGVPAFARSLQHTDWIDGESVVQAEETSAEQGFNRRFHAVEDDVDALAANVAKAFTCVAEMREDLFAMLNEVRDELNRINADIHQCCHSASPGSVIVDTIPNIDMEYVDTTKFLDKYVQIYKGAQGLTMLPAIEQEVVNPAFDPRVARTAKLGRFIEEDPRVRQQFGEGGFTIAAFTKAFGRAEVAGMTVASLVSILPANSRFSTLDAMVGEVATREGAALRTSDTGETAVVNAFGIDVDVASVAEAPIERFAAVPKDARVALAAQGVNTIAALIAAGPEKLAAILENEGVAAGRADAAEWAAAGRALVAVR